MNKFMQFLLKVDKSIMKHFVILAEMKRGATTTITKRYHGNVPVPVTRLRSQCKESVAGACKRWWGDPGNRVSHESMAWKRETLRTRCRQRVHLIHHKHSFSDDRLGVIPLKRALSKCIESA